jgi:O-antigen/teichoic acid export membrane protein
MFNGTPRPSRALLSRSSVFLTANLVTGALWFALLPVLARLMSPSEFGEAAMFSTVVGALVSVVGLNAASAAARRYYDGLAQGELADFIGACLQILVASGAVCLLVVVALREPLSALVGVGPDWLPWAVLAAGFAAVLQLRLVQWQVRGKARPYAVLQIGEAGLSAAASVLLIVGFAQGAAGRIEGILVAGAVAAGLSLLLLRRSGLLRAPAWHPRHLGDALHYGVPLVPHVMAGVVLTAADRVVVTSDLGLAQAGVYLLAVHVAQGAVLVFDAVNKAFVPWLFERLKAGERPMQRRIVRYTYAWFVLLLAGALAGFAMGPWLVRLVGGERYAAAGSVIGWLLLGQVFGGMYLMVTNYLFYAKRTGLLSAVTVASGLFQVLLLLALTPRLGIQGAAIAFSAAMGVRFLLTWWAAHRSHPMPWFASLPRVVGGLRGKHFP